jgi:hypothetical protein
LREAVPGRFALNEAHATARRLRQQPTMLPVRDHLPTRSVAGINYALIAINVVAFVFEIVRF